MSEKTYPKASFADLPTPPPLLHSSINSTFARGTTTRSPPSNSTSNTRTIAPDSTSCNSAGNPLTRPI